jgi:hypothetical protein
LYAQDGSGAGRRVSPADQLEGVRWPTDSSLTAPIDVR